MNSSRFYKVFLLTIIFVMSFAIHAVAETDQVEDQLVEENVELLEEFDDSDQIREVVDDLITIVSRGDYDQNEANQMIERINSIDANLRQGLIDQGITMILVDFPITDLEEYSYLKGEVPRGWEDTGSTWDDVPGAGGNPSVARIGYSEFGMGHGSINLELHEIAHAIDNYVLDNVGQSPAFLEIQAEEQPNFLPSNYFQYSIEYFAESFAYYYLNEQTRAELREKAPKTYALIESFSEFSNETPGVSKEGLQELIEEAQAMEDEFITNTLTEAILQATNVVEDENATQKEVDQAADALRAAIIEATEIEDEPETPVNLDELAKAMEEADTVEDELVTDELKEALQQAISVNDKDDATQEEVDQAVDALRAAVREAAKNKDELVNPVNKDDATQEEVDQAVDALRAAVREATKNKDELVNPVNKDELAKAIEEADTVEDELVTDELKEALQQAISVNDKDDATQEEVDQAVKALRAQIADATKRVQEKMKKPVKKDESNKEVVVHDPVVKEDQEENEVIITKQSNDENLLPNTATNMYTYLMIGLLLLFIGGITLYSRARFAK